MIILKIIGKFFYYTFAVLFWVMFLPFRLLFWWVPTGSDSYEDSDEEWLFWKGHGRNW